MCISFETLLSTSRVLLFVQVLYLCVSALFSPTFGGRFMVLIPVGVCPEFVTSLVCKVMRDPRAVSPTVFAQ